MGKGSGKETDLGQGVCGEQAASISLCKGLGFVLLIFTFVFLFMCMCVHGVGVHDTCVVRRQLREFVISLHPLSPRD